MSVFLRLDIDLFAASYLAIVFYLAYRRLDHEDSFNKLFFKGCALVLTLTLFEAATCYFNHKTSLTLRWISSVMHIFLFSMPPLLTYYWYLLADTLTRHGNVRDIRVKWTYLIPVAFTFVIAVLSPAFHFVFYIDEGGVYHRGPMFSIVMIISYAYLLMGFLVLIKRRNKLEDMEFTFLTLFCLLPLIGGMVQGLVYGVLLMWPSSACALTILYLYLQERMVQTDYLTGAWTRSSFEYYVTQKLKSNEKHPFGVIYVDIDNLKMINDKFGHSEGDVAIKAAACAIKCVLRKGDAVARLGGDEFAILLNVASREDLDTILRRIDAAIQNYNETSGKPFSLSLSHGADLFWESSEDNVKNIICQVDELMYTHKRNKNPLGPVGQHDAGCRGDIENEVPPSNPPFVG